MGSVKRVFATLGLFFFLCPGTAVHAQEKMATYSPFAPGYISIKVFDNQSRFVGRLLPERRYWVSIDQIPVFLQNALVAIEDSRFYEHGAIDLRGITRALVKDVIKPCTARTTGDSTLRPQHRRRHLSCRRQTTVLFRPISNSGDIRLQVIDEATILKEKGGNIKLDIPKII